MGYVLPLGLTALVCSGVWLTGLGRFSPADLASAPSSSYGVALNSGVTLVPISFAVTATVFVVIGALTALGEELGWRGFLVPELARSTSFHRVALVSGGIWAAWHAPLIVFADYNAGHTRLVQRGVLQRHGGQRRCRLRVAAIEHGQRVAGGAAACQPQLFHPDVLRPRNGQHGAHTVVTTEFGLGLALVWFGVAAYL